MMRSVSKNIGVLPYPLRCSTSILNRFTLEVMAKFFISQIVMIANHMYILFNIGPESILEKQQRRHKRPSVDDLLELKTYPLKPKKQIHRATA